MISPRLLRTESKMSSGKWIETAIPARMDRLPWSRWHWLVVVALGVTWILDGLQSTLGGAIGPTLKDASTLALTNEQIGMGSSFYLTGAVIGALVFGYGTDRFGRKKLFYITLIVYLSGVLLTAFAWNFPSYACFLAITGSGIGGEYAAINSAIDELIPARLRGRVDLIINSTYWLGAAMGAGVTVLLLDPKLLPLWLGWRLAFGLGAALGLIVLIFRTWVPESPRWLMIHGKSEEAERIVQDIERTVSNNHPETLPEYEHFTIRIKERTHTPLLQIWNAIVHEHRSRSFLGLALMSSQAFFYNAIFFTYGLVLTDFFQIPAQQVGNYILPFALGNLLGPVLTGHLFDTIGRKKMIVATYGLSGILLAVTAILFKAGMLTADTQSLAWTIIFFIASSAASSAYLTVSEIFPLEIRGMAIAIFYAIGTLVGGVAGPTIFAKLIATHSREALTWGYLAGASFMIIAAVFEAVLGVDAEGKSLESITAPLSTRDD